MAKVMVAVDAVQRFSDGLYAQIIEVSTDSSDPGAQLVRIAHNGIVFQGERRTNDHVVYTVLPEKLIRNVDLFWPYVWSLISHGLPFATEAGGGGSIEWVWTRVKNAIPVLEMEIRSADTLLARLLDAAERQDFKHVRGWLVDHQMTDHPVGLVVEVVDPDEEADLAYFLDVSESNSHFYAGVNAVAAGARDSFVVRFYTGTSGTYLRFRLQQD
ncbi:MAG: hypothetical protein ABIB97_03565 [Patescibacteria group bacterium]